MMEMRYQIVVNEWHFIQKYSSMGTGELFMELTKKQVKWNFKKDLR